ncbi:unnamed protein product, partial [Laminaria digitata]
SRFCTAWGGGPLTDIATTRFCRVGEPPHERCPVSNPVSGARLLINPFSTGNPFLGTKYLGIVLGGVLGLLTPLGPHSRFGDTLTLIPSNLSPKRDCGAKRVKGLTSKPRPCLLLTR